MAPELFDIIVKEFVGAIRRDLEEATGLVLAAETCASTGNLGKAVEIANDIDEFTHDAGRLLNTVAFLARRHRHWPPELEAQDDE